MAEWWHVIDLPDGSTTPGAWDLRPLSEELPWPDVHGKRCLDIGTADGFWAFEMERRGAAEVLATDQDTYFGQKSRRNFEHARDLRASQAGVRRSLHGLRAADGRGPDPRAPFRRARRPHAHAPRHRQPAAVAPACAARAARRAPRRP